MWVLVFIFTLLVLVWAAHWSTNLLAPKEFPMRRRNQWQGIALSGTNVAWGVFLFVGLVSVLTWFFGDRADLRLVTYVGGFGVVSLVYLVPVFGWIIRHVVVLVGILPGVLSCFVMGMIHMMRTQPDPGIMEFASGFGLLWVITAAATLGWSGVAWIIFSAASLWGLRPKLGPLTETIKMAWLVTPWFVGAIIWPFFLELDHASTISIVSSLAISLLWGPLLGQPFARFVRALM